MQQASQIRVCDSGLRLGSAPNLSPDPQPNPRKIPLPAGLRALDELEANRVAWIALIPFGWQPRLDTPQVQLRTTDVRWGETDAGLVETAAGA